MRRPAGSSPRRRPRCPEWIGGVRNWDYRYCWLRDTTLTLMAMIRAGYSEEAIAWRQWLLRAIAGDPADVQIMYGLAGERRLEERVLDWLPGYEESTPGPRRQRRLRAASARRLRRGDRRALPDPRPRCARRRQHLGSRPQAARVARGRLAPRGRRHLGGARPEPALHPLEGDGLGRLRPRRSRPRGVRPRRALSSAGASSGRRSRRRFSSSAWNPDHRCLRAVLRRQRARRERPR